MTERVLWSEQLPEREQVAQVLVDRALSEIDARYGPNGRRRLYYHDGQHTADCLEAGTMLVDQVIANGRLEPAAREVVRLAAAYHDWEQDFGPDNTQFSAVLLESRMSQSHVFSLTDIRNARRMVMSTEVAFRGEHMYRVNPPADMLTALIVDADMSMLGRPWELFWDRAQRLLQERKGRQPTHQQLIQFVHMEVGFLQEHGNFYTEEARQLFRHCPENIELVKQKIEQLQAS